MRRVVVTGLGVISSIGNNLNDFWDSLENGISGIDWIKAFDTEKFRAKVAGEIKGFDPVK